MPPHFQCWNQLKHFNSQLITPLTYRRLTLYRIIEVTGSLIPHSQTHSPLTDSRTHSTINAPRIIQAAADRSKAIESFETSGKEFGLDDADDLPNQIKGFVRPLGTPQNFNPVRTESSYQKMKSSGHNFPSTQQAVLTQY